MDYTQYYHRVYQVRGHLNKEGAHCGDKKWCNVTKNPDHYAVYDSHPDHWSTATGIKIPILDWDEEGEYQFEICLFGESDMIEVNKMDVGWSFNIEYGGLQSTWRYGYICDNNIELPDLCGAKTTTYMDEQTGTLMSIDYGRHDSMTTTPAPEVEVQSESSKNRTGTRTGKGKDEDVLGILSNEEQEVGFGHRYTLWNVVAAHQTFLFVAVLVVLGIGIFVTTFAHCIEYKTDGKSYGHVIKFVESDVDHDDNTDSELDEDLMDDQ